MEVTLPWKIIDYEGHVKFVSYEYIINELYNFDLGNDSLSWSDPLEIRLRRLLTPIFHPFCTSWRLLGELLYGNLFHPDAPDWMLTPQCQRLYEFIKQPLPIYFQDVLKLLNQDDIKSLKESTAMDVSFEISQKDSSTSLGNVEVASDNANTTIGDISNVMKSLNEPEVSKAQRTNSQIHLLRDPRRRADQKVEGVTPLVMNVVNPLPPSPRPNQSLEESRLGGGKGGEGGGVIAVRQREIGIVSLTSNMKDGSSFSRPRGETLASDRASAEEASKEERLKKGRREEKKDEGEIGREDKRTITLRDKGRGGGGGGGGDKDAAKEVERGETMERVVSMNRPRTMTSAVELLEASYEDLLSRFLSRYGRPGAVWDDDVEDWFHRIKSLGRKNFRLRMEQGGNHSTYNAISGSNKEYIETEVNAVQLADMEKRNPSGIDQAIVTKLSNGSSFSIPAVLMPYQGDLKYLMSLSSKLIPTGREESPENPQARSSARRRGRGSRSMDARMIHAADGKEAEVDVKQKAGELNALTERPHAHVQMEQSMDPKPLDPVEQKDPEMVLKDDLVEEQTPLLVEGTDQQAIQKSQLQESQKAQQHSHPSLTPPPMRIESSSFPPPPPPPPPALSPNPPQSWQFPESTPLPCPPMFTSKVFVTGLMSSDPNSLVSSLYELNRRLERYGKDTNIPTNNGTGLLPKPAPVISRLRSLLAFDGAKRPEYDIPELRTQFASHPLLNGDPNLSSISHFYSSSGSYTGAGGEMGISSATLSFPSHSSQLSSLYYNSLATGHINQPYGGYPNSSIAFSSYPGLDRFLLQCNEEYLNPLNSLHPSFNQYPHGQHLSNNYPSIQSQDIHGWNSNSFPAMGNGGNNRQHGGSDYYIKDPLRSSEFNLIRSPSKVDSISTQVDSIDNASGNNPTYVYRSRSSAMTSTSFEVHKEDIRQRITKHRSRRRSRNHSGHNEHRRHIRHEREKEKKREKSRTRGRNSNARDRSEIRRREKQSGVTKEKRSALHSKKRRHHKDYSKDDSEDGNTSQDAYDDSDLSTPGTDSDDSSHKDSSRRRSEKRRKNKVKQVENIISPKSLSSSSLSSASVEKERVGSGKTKGRKEGTAVTIKKEEKGASVTERQKSEKQIVKHFKTGTPTNPPTVEKETVLGVVPIAPLSQGDMTRQSLVDPILHAPKVQFSDSDMDLDCLESSFESENAMKATGQPALRPVPNPSVSNPNESGLSLGFTNGEGYNHEKATKTETQSSFLRAGEGEEESKEKSEVGKSVVEQKVREIDPTMPSNAERSMSIASNAKGREKNVAEQNVKGEEEKVQKEHGMEAPLYRSEKSERNSSKAKKSKSSKSSRLNATSRKTRKGRHLPKDGTSRKKRRPQDELTFSLSRSLSDSSDLDSEGNYSDSEFSPSSSPGSRNRSLDDDETDSSATLIDSESEFETSSSSSRDGARGRSRTKERKERRDMKRSKRSRNVSHHRRSASKRRGNVHSEKRGRSKTRSRHNEERQTNRHQSQFRNQSVKRAKMGHAKDHSRIRGHDNRSSRNEVDKNDSGDDDKSDGDDSNLHKRGRSISRARKSLPQNESRSESKGNRKRHRSKSNARRSLKPGGKKQLFDDSSAKKHSGASHASSKGNDLADNAEGKGDDPKKTSRRKDARSDASHRHRKDPDERKAEGHHGSSLTISRHRNPETERTLGRSREGNSSSLKETEVGGVSNEAGIVEKDSNGPDKNTNQRNGIVEDNDGYAAPNEDAKRSSAPHSKEKTSLTYEANHKHGQISHSIRPDGLVNPFGSLTLPPPSAAVERLNEWRRKVGEDLGIGSAANAVGHAHRPKALTPSQQGENAKLRDDRGAEKNDVSNSRPQTTAETCSHAGECEEKASPVNRNALKKQEKQDFVSHFRAWASSHSNE